MTPERILEWQCQMFIYTSLLYYKHDISAWSDDLFDQHCKWLLDRYDRLPAWFTARVTEGDLRAGTGFALEYTDEEERDALWWHNDLRLRLAS